MQTMISERTRGHRRCIWWNHVASFERRLDDAWQSWRDKGYPMVDGDPQFIPLPEGGRVPFRVASGHGMTDNGGAET